MKLLNKTQVTTCTFYVEEAPRLRGLYAYGEYFDPQAVEVASTEGSEEIVIQIRGVDPHGNPSRNVYYRKNLDKLPDWASKLITENLND